VLVSGKRVAGAWDLERVLEERPFYVKM